MLDRELSRDTVHVRLRALLGRALGKPPDDRKGVTPTVAGEALPLEGEVQPVRAVPRPRRRDIEALGHHAYHGMPATVQLEG